jgi:GTP-binding protein HflX
MFERPASGESAVLVQLDFGEGDFAERLSEFRLLVGSAGAQAVGGGFRASARGRIRRLFAGKGKVAEIGDAVRLHEADVVVFNHELARRASSATWRRSSNAA